jgi:hypothetical protein
LYKHKSGNGNIFFLTELQICGSLCLLISPTILAAEAKRGGDMDGGGEEGQQHPHLVLAHKLFLLSHPDVDDLAKVDLRADVLTAVKSDGSGSSYLLLELDSSCG